MNAKEQFAALWRWTVKPKRLRDITPKGLFGRSLLIIALPVALMQIAVLWMFFDSQWETVTTRLSEGVAGDVAIIVEQFEHNPNTENLTTLSQISLEKMSLSVVLHTDEILPTNINASVFSVLDRTLRKALNARLQTPFWFDTTRYPAYVDIRVQTSVGILRFIAPRDKVFSTTGHIFVLWLIAATFIQTGIAVIFIHNQVKPIRRLANAADQFGRGQDDPDFSPSGAREVRRAAAAFIKMRNRMHRFVEQRTIMLAGVSHDLRTPLTRLKLQLALMEKRDELTAALQDIREMEGMLDGYLSFARGETQEQTEVVDLSALLNICAQNARRSNTNIQTEIEHDLWVSGRKETLARCISNLVDNAMRYGNNTHITARRRTDAIEIAIEDDGPGINEHLYEDAFKPFNRLDPSRNLNTEGVGLGLAIARDGARAHGGELVLEKSEFGGLRAVMLLPEKTRDQD